MPRAPFRERDRGLKSSAPHRWWPDKVLSPPRKIRHDGPAWDVAGRESSTFDLSARAVARPSAPFARSSLIVYSTRKSQLNLASKRLRLSMRPQSDKSTLVAHVVSALISTTGVGALSVGPAQFPFHLLGRDTDESDAHPDSNRLLPAQSWPTGDAVREGDGPGELELLRPYLGRLSLTRLLFLFFPAAVPHQLCANGYRLHRRHQGQSASLSSELAGLTQPRDVSQPSAELTCRSLPVFSASTCPMAYLIRLRWRALPRCTLSSHSRRYSGCSSLACTSSVG